MLMTWHNLAFWTCKAGDVAEARDQFAPLLPVCERVSGAKYPDTLTTRASLARWTRETPGLRVRCDLAPRVHFAYRSVVSPSLTHD